VLVVFIKGGVSLALTLSLSLSLSRSRSRSRSLPLSLSLSDREHRRMADIKFSSIVAAGIGRGIRERFGNAVVKVVTMGEKLNVFDQNEDGASFAALGSGVVIAHDASATTMLVLTNAHVVSNARAVTGLAITRPEWRVGKILVTPVMVNRERDIALIAIHRPLQTLKARRERDADADLDTIIEWLEAVEPVDVRPAGTNAARAARRNMVDAGVFVIGFPLGQTAMVITQGTVTAIQKLDNRIMLQTDAAMNHGNSGGLALVADGMGGVVYGGIPSAGFEGSQNVAYFCPAWDVANIVAATLAFPVGSTRMTEGAVVPLLNMSGPVLGISLSQYDPAKGGFEVTAIANPYEGPVAAAAAAAATENGRNVGLGSPFYGVLQAGDVLTGLGGMRASLSGFCCPRRRGEGESIKKGSRVPWAGFSLSAEDVLRDAVIGAPFSLAFKRMQADSPAERAEFMAHSDLLSAGVALPVAFFGAEQVVETAGPLSLDVNMGIRWRETGIEGRPYEDLLGLTVAPLDCAHLSHAGFLQFAPALKRYTVHNRRYAPVLIIVEVDNESPAAAAGFKRGDILRTLNGVPVADIAQLRSMMADLDSSDMLFFGFEVDSGRRMKLTVTPAMLISASERSSAARKTRVTESVRRMEFKLFAGNETAFESAVVLPAAFENGTLDNIFVDGSVVDSTAGNRKAGIQRLSCTRPSCTRTIDAADAATTTYCSSLCQMRHTVPTLNVF
jgi:S1-C subfamily serine protease